MSEPLLTTAQAAEQLGVPAHVITRWRRTRRAMPAGLLPAPVPGGQIPLWDLPELRPLAEAYTARNRQRRRVRRRGVVAPD